MEVVKEEKGVKVRVVKRLIPSKLVGRELGEGEGLGLLLHAAHDPLTYNLAFPST